MRGLLDLVNESLGDFEVAWLVACPAVNSDTYRASCAPSRPNTKRWISPGPADRRDPAVSHVSTAGTIVAIGSSLRRAAGSGDKPASRPPALPAA